MTKTRKTKVKPHLRKTRKGKVPVRKHGRNVKVAGPKKKYKRVLPGVQVADDVTVLGFVEDVKDSIVRGYKKQFGAFEFYPKGTKEQNEIFESLMRYKNPEGSPSFKRLTKEQQNFFKEINRGSLGVDFLKKAKLIEGQMRSMDKRVGKNLGWYDKEGKKIGWGDLSEDDVKNIIEVLPKDEKLYLLGEHDSFWKFVKTPGITGEFSEVDKEKELNPGLDFVKEKYWFKIDKEKGLRRKKDED